MKQLDAQVFLAVLIEILDHFGNRTYQKKVWDGTIWQDIRLNMRYNMYNYYLRNSRRLKKYIGTDKHNEVESAWDEVKSLSVNLTPHVVEIRNKGVRIGWVLPNQAGFIYHSTLDGELLTPDKVIQVYRSITNKDSIIELLPLWIVTKDELRKISPTQVGD